MNRGEQFVNQPMNLKQQIQAVQDRLLQIQQQTGNSAAQNPLLAEAIVELSQCLEALQASQDPWQPPTLVSETITELQILYDQSPCGYHSLDAEGTFIRINDTELSMLGYRREEVVGQKKFPDLLTPESQLTFEQNFPQFKQRGWVQDLEFSMIRKDGSILPVSLSATVIRDRAGNYLMSRSIVIDISERKRLEAERNAAQMACQIIQQQRRLALELTHIGWWDWDVLTDRLAWSDQLFQLLGYVPGEVTPSVQAWRDRIHPDDLEWTIQALNRDLDQQTIGQVEYRVVHPDGSLHWLLVKGQAIGDAAGSAVRMVGIVMEISDRKQLEAEQQAMTAILRASEQRYRLMFANHPNPMWLYDPQTLAFLEVNQAAIDHYGYSRAEFLQKTLVDIRPPEEITEFLQAFSQYQPESTYLGIGRHCRKDGSVIDVEITAYRLEVEHQPMNLALIKDITELKRLDAERQQAEAALRLSEEQRRLALDLTNTNSWDWNLTTGEVVWSDNMPYLFGLPPGTVRPDYTTWRSCVHPEDIARLEASVVLHLRNHTLYAEEYRIICPDGSVRWLLSKGQGVYDEAGQAIRMVGITLDISDHKQLELSLQASEAKLSRILDSAIAVIVSFRVWDNQDWEYEYWSAGCEILYGFTVEELQADKTLWLSRVLPEDRETILMPLFEDFFTEKNTIAEYRFRHKDGSIRWIASTYASEQITPHCWMVTSVNYDITDRKHLEQSLLQLNAELELRVADRTRALEQALQAAEAANRAKGIFLGQMSHELRTPLHAILGFSQILSRNNALDTEQQEQIEIINQSGEHLLNLINDILEMSRLEAGQTTLTSSNVNLVSLLDQLRDFFCPKAESQGLQLLIQSEANVPPQFRVDGNKLRQVLIHLLSNAIKFTQAGQVTLQIRLGEPQQTPEIAAVLASYAVASERVTTDRLICLHFSIQDTGVGIDPLIQETLFEPFWRPEPDQGFQEGAGLGLPICQQFVRLMGGELSFITTPGQGSTFFFQIPILPISPADLTDRSFDQTLAPQVMRLAPDQPCYRVLVVDDHLEDRQWLMQLLQAVGFEIQAADHGQQAVRVWQQWQPHLIWMKMPTMDGFMDGYQAVRQIRSLEAAQPPPQPASESTPAVVSPNRPIGDALPAHGPPRPTLIIALTTNAFESEWATILATGCNDLVCQPMTTAVLLDKMAEHLGVQYIYSESIESESIESEPIEAIAALESPGWEAASSLLLLIALQTLSTEWILQLQQAARMADEEQILQLLTQIPLTEPLLANTLHQWVDQFQLEQVIHLTTVAMQQRSV